MSEQEFTIINSEESNKFFVALEWREDALCKGMCTNDFFPERINKFNSSKVKTIIKMCEECPVRIECFVEAANYDYDGMWGGILEKQRRSWMKYNGFVRITEKECKDFFNVNTNHKPNLQKES